MKRYPLADLLEAAGMSLSQLRELCPMNGTVYRNARAIGLTEEQADRWCCKVGLVPWLVWSDWLDGVADEARAAYNARKARSERLRYHRDPRRRQQALENARKYQQECSAYKNAQKRARRQWLKDNDPERLRAMDRAAYQKRKDRDRSKITDNAGSIAIRRQNASQTPHGTDGEVAA